MAIVSGCFVASANRRSYEGLEEASVSSRARGADETPAPARRCPGYLIAHRK
jgi:hypothetical protein